MMFYIVDAFTQELFGGNPAGVVLLENETDFPADEMMVKTAAELRYSETAFVKQIGENEFLARYFTPTDEVDLCGHATIGTFGCLLEANRVKPGGKYFLTTKAGRLAIEIKDGLVYMEMGEAVELDTLLNAGEIAEILGLTLDDIGMKPKIISTGLPDIMVHIKTKDSLMRIKPDFNGMSKLSQRVNAVGIHAFALSEEKGITATCRNFAPLYGIDEEAATGTSNGALTYYLFKEKLIKKGETNTFLQGESMGRPSRIITRLDGDAPYKIRVGGSFKILAKGELFI